MTHNKAEVKRREQRRGRQYIKLLIKVKWFHLRGADPFQADVLSLPKVISRDYLSTDWSFSRLLHVFHSSTFHIHLFIIPDAYVLVRTLCVSKYLSCCGVFEPDSKLSLDKVSQYYIIVPSEFFCYCFFLWTRSCGEGKHLGFNEDDHLLSKHH